MKDNVRPTLNKEEAARFLKALDPDATFFTFQTFDDNKERKKAHDAANKQRKKEGKRRLPDPYAHIRHGTLDERWDWLVGLNEQGAGIFVTVNETDRKGRTIENIKRVRALFVDLDGAPLEPAVAWHTPHITVESSEGKFHAYWIVKNDIIGLENDEFTKLQKSLAKQFGGDESVSDLPRVMRIPGFIHQKGPPYLTRILSIDARAPYNTLDELGIVPDYLKDHTGPTGAEEVEKLKSASWQDELNTAALDNLSAWVPKLWPDAKRTRKGGYRVDGDILGRDLEEDLSFYPNPGGGIKDFGKADQGDKRKGGRTALQVVFEYGNRGDYNQCIAWLSEQLGISTDEGVKLSDFVAYMEGTYLFMPTRGQWAANKVNARLGKIPLLDKDGKPLLDEEDDNKPITIPASVWLDKYRPVEQITWAPGEPMLIEDRYVMDGGWIKRGGMRVFNMYRPPTIIPGDAAKVQPWLDHLHKVFNEDDASHIVTWCACRVQHPAIKINHVLVVGSEDHGIGKDTTFVPVREAIGVWNCSEVSAQQLMGRFNGYLMSVILRINEARDLGEMNRYQFYEHLKEYAASPPETLRVDEKNLREYSIFNCVGIIITTNHKTTGIYLPAEDRRHYVAWSDRRKEDFAPDYWVKLYEWYAAGGNGHVAAYLRGLNLSHFDPKAPPPHTAAFRAIVNAGRAPEDNQLADLIEDLKNPPVITIAWLIEKAMEIDFSSGLSDWLSNNKNYRLIPHRIETCGYQQVPNADRKDNRWTLNGSKVVIYARRDIEDQQQAVSEFIKVETDRLGHLPKKNTLI